MRHRETDDMIQRTHPRNFRGDGRRGTALLIATIALVTIAVIGAAFMRLGVATKSECNAALDQDRAFYICEAAIAESGAAIAAGRTGGIASEALPAQFGSGLFWVTSTDLGNGDRQLDATAMCDSGRSSIRAVVHTAVASQFTAALIGDTSVTLASNAQLDSFDSNKGTYASQPRQTVNGKSIVKTNGHIRSNGTLSVSSNDQLFGNVTPGPGNTVAGIAGSVYINGNTNPATATMPFPAVTVPTIASMGSRTIAKTDSAAARTLVAGNYHYASLTIGNQAAFTIQGPSTVVLDNFDTSSGCSLMIDGTTGPVTIYFTGVTHWVSNMTVTSNGATAKDVSLVFTSTDPVDLASNADLLGTVYAPNTSVSISSNWAISGACMAKSVNLASNVNIHYDEALAGGGKNGLPVQTISSWFRAPLPTAKLGKKRSDPFALLGVSRANCPYPANAWQ
jgi:Tfp pilus assembly protein PilX